MSEEQIAKGRDFDRRAKNAFYNKREIEEELPTVQEAEAYASSARLGVIGQISRWLFGR
jgi:hypothetical protein